MATWGQKSVVFIGAALLAAGPLGAQSSGMARLGALVGGQAVKMTGTWSVRWLPGAGGYLDAADPSGEGAGLRRVDAVTGTARPLLVPAALARLSAEFRRVAGAPLTGALLAGADFERDGKVIAFNHAGSRYLLRPDSGTVHRLDLPSRTGPLDQATPEPGQFSPDYRRYAFIRDYDHLWVRDVATGTETRISAGGGEDNLIGFLGAGPWFVWSPDGNRIAYFKADQSMIGKYPLLRDTARTATVDWFRYPFATDPNPVLELHVADLATHADVVVARSTEEDPFLRDIAWFPDSKEVTFQIVNRWESRLRLEAADPVTGAHRTVLTEEDPAYLDPLHNFRVLADGRRFLWSGERTGYRHLYLYDRDGRQLAQLTRGDIETGEVVGVDEARGQVYLTGATRLGLEQHLFRARLDGSGFEAITTEPGWHEVTVDPAARTFLDRYSSLGAAPVAVLKTIDGRALRTLGSSDTTGLKALGLLAPELVPVKSADGQDSYGILFKPADFDSARKYPVIVSVYGGPHTKAVRNQFETAEYRSALAQLGFLVFQVDGRGTLGRGKKFQTGNYLRMGQDDVDDQAAAVRQLRNRPWVDSTRVGVTGISHGGYLTLMMMLRYPDVFQVGVSGAPITDLANGPRQYIGRIMRTPQANPEGYARGNVLKLAPTLKGRLMVQYGTDDHNAVNANSMQLLRVLIDAGRPVDASVYPQGSHVLAGTDALHGIKSTIGYFLEHLRPDNWEANLRALWQ